MQTSNAFRCEPPECRAHKAAYLRRLFGTLVRWYDLYRQRRQLAALSDSELKDMGISRADALYESGRPFWDDPECRHQKLRRADDARAGTGRSSG